MKKNRDMEPINQDVIKLKNGKQIHFFIYDGDKAVIYKKHWETIAPKTDLNVTVLLYKPTRDIRGLDVEKQERLTVWPDQLRRVIDGFKEKGEAYFKEL